MNEGAKQYKAFAAAAERAGLDKDERKLASMDPSFLLEEANDTLREKVTPEMLLAFFHTLIGDPNANDQSLVQIGNFLYRYRTDKEEKAKLKKSSLRGEEEKPLSLNEHDRKLVKLACHLLEDAFYDGRLGHLPENQAGAVAFVVNTLAKIIDQKVLTNAADLFDADRLRNFIQDVSVFEQKTLFPGADPENVLSPRAQKLEEMKQDFSAQLEIIDRIEKETDWREYFSILADALDSLATSLTEASIETHSIPTVSSTAWFLETRWKKILEIGKQFSHYLHSPDRLAKPEAYCFTMKDFSLLAVLSQLAQKEKDETRERTVTPDERLQDLPGYAPAGHHTYGSLPLLLVDLQKRLSAVDASAAKKFSSLQALGEIKTKKELPGLIKTLESICKIPPEPLLSYQQATRRALEILEKRDAIHRADDMFMVGKRRFEAGASQPIAVPYLIKDLIIANSIVERGGFEDALANLRVPHNWKARGEKNPSHQIIVTGMRDISTTTPRYASEGPEYANLHFIEEDLPFAVWIRRYFRSKNTKPQKADS